MGFSTKEVFRWLNESLSPPSSPQAYKGSCLHSLPAEAPSARTPGDQPREREATADPLEVISQATQLPEKQPGDSPADTISQLDVSPSGKDTMSTESMIRDVELAETVLPKKAGGLQGSRRCLCLSLFSFLLVAGATTLFCLLHFGVIGPQREEVSASPAWAPSPTQREMGVGEGG